MAVKKAARIFFKTIMWAVLGLLGLVALILALLYLPPVQDFVVPKVLSSISKPGEMELSVKKFRLSFPLKVKADSLRMLTPGMEVKVSEADLKVAVSPLLYGDIVVDRLNLRSTDFRLGTPDSAFYMNAAVDRAGLDGARVNLGSQRVDLNKIAIDSGLIAMAIKPDTVPEPPKTDSVPVNWHILLKEGLLTRIDYNMTIDPTITDLSCYLAEGQINGADVDMRDNSVKVKEILMQQANARYIYPTPEYLAAHPVPEIPADTVAAASLPWTVTVDRLSLTGSRALYAMNGARPLCDNLDLNYIEATEIDIEIDSLYNRSTAIKAPIRRIHARERCGIPLELKGLFEMDSTAMHADGITLTTPSSSIALTAMMGLAPATPEKAAASQNGSQNGSQRGSASSQKSSATAADNLPFSAELTAEISNDDLRRLAPAPMQQIVDGLPRGVPLYLTADARGTMQDINVKSIALSIPRHLSLEASGHVTNPTDLDRCKGELSLKGAMPDGKFLKPTLMDAKMAREINIPPMTLSGDVALNRGDIDGKINATAADGSLALEGEWHNRVKGYGVTLETNRFPLQSIMPALGISDITASIDLDGEGLDPFSPKTTARGRIDLKHVGYKGVPYNNLTADIALADGHADIEAVSDNAGARFNLKADGNLAGDTLRWNFDGDVKEIDLKALHLSDSVGDGSVNLRGNAAFTLPRREVIRRGRRKIVKDIPMTLKADLDVRSLYWHMAGGTVNATDLLANVELDSAAIKAEIDNHDLSLKASAGMGLDSLLARVTRTTSLLDRCLERRALAVDSLQKALPPFDIDLVAGKNNVMASYLLDSDISFDSLRVNLSNDSVKLINAAATLTGLKSGETRIDSLALDIFQHNNILRYSLVMDNKPGTFDQFAHVIANGFIAADKFSLIMNQKNIKDETGFSFGSVVTMGRDNTFTLRFVPYHPIIGYKDWEINRNNFISYNLSTRHVDADIDLRNAASSLRLFTAHSEASDSTGQEDIHLQLSDIKLEDWLAINPFAPPMKGNLSADMKVNFGEKSLNGDGTIALRDFFYGKDKVGDFDLALDVSTNAAGTIRANTSLMVDGVKTITLSGNLNDSTAANPFLLDFKMIHFPLAVVNPFLPKGMARLSGMLNGEMDVTGEMSEPTLNGWINFDSTEVKVDMFGTSLSFSPEKIPVKDNLITFDKFDIKAVNENPLVIDGTVDITRLSAAKLNLALTASNTQIIGSQKKRGQDAYGKAFIDLDAKVKGDMSRYMVVDAFLKVLPGTNVTYVIPDVQAAIAARSNAEMVKFVNFNDTTAVAAADSITQSSLAMILDATVEISEGSTIAVDLSTDGKNRAQLQASGRVNYTSDYLGDERVTGRINLNQGFVRYSMPPVLSEKLFHIEEGSYVVFNGPMLNPVLNLHAYDEIKANVNTDGNSRMATFDVKLGVTGSLENMNVAFDLSTSDDLTVENELQSMSPDQRANQAMNMLLYGQYTGPGTKASTMGNPIYSFLEGQLNNLASSAIKGVDISFGIDQLDRTRDGVNSSAMSYSYRVSKSLFDDRFKIVVGGNYTTDANADENFSQNLISDISFEYLINKTGTMYVKLFRHTGYESILEGEITQTGVGFVYKKKLRSFSDLFNWLRPRRKEEAKQND